MGCELTGHLSLNELKAAVMNFTFEAEKVYFFHDDLVPLCCVFVGGTPFCCLGAKH